MSAQIANIFLTTILKIHRDMDSVSFFEKNEETKVIRNELNAELDFLEKEISEKNVSSDGFVSNFRPILKKLLDLYKRSYDNLVTMSNTKKDQRLTNLGSLINEFDSTVDHFSYTKISICYSHILEIDRLFKVMTKK